MSQKLPVNNFEWIKDTCQSDEDFIKNYNEESDEGNFPEVNAQCEKIHEFDDNLPFLSERTKIKKVEKLATTLHDKSEYVIHIRNLKQALNNGLVLRKVRRVIKFNQKAWLKTYFDMNTKLRKNSKK